MNSARLLRTLQIIFNAQAREVARWLSLSKVERGELPDLTHWVKIIANTTKPMLLHYYQLGMTGAYKGYRGKLERPRVVVNDEVWTYSPGNEHLFDATKTIARPGPSFARWEGRLGGLIIKSKQKPDLYRPHILDAVDAATFTFCRETNATAITNLKEATDKLREQMRQGLSRGASLRRLAAIISETFADPARAYRIAVTETARAINGGKLLYGKDVGAQQKEWLAGPNACSKCLELHENKVDINKPFWVDLNGGPYAMVQAPPLHPFCYCNVRIF